MNTQQNNLFATISNEETICLTAVVIETLAINLNQHKAFTAADLWAIQRRRRSFVQRRHNAC